MTIRVKNVTLGIRPLKEGLDNFVDVAEAIMRGEKVKKQRGVYFDNLDYFRKVLTEKRLELLHTIKREKPETIKQLAELTGRDIKNVSDDLKFLAGLDLVTLDRDMGKKRGRVTPRVGYDKIRIEIAI